MSQCQLLQGLQPEVRIATSHLHQEDNGQQDDQDNARHWLFSSLQDTGNSSLSWQPL